MSLGRQIAIAVVLLAVLAAGGYWHLERRPESGAEAAVRPGPTAIPVETAAARAGAVQQRIEAVGTTIARQAINIVPVTSGRVVEITFSPGAQVEAGALLVRLDDVAEQAAVDEARAELRERELALERAQRLRANNTVAQATVDELQAVYLAARARLDRVEKALAERRILAPFAGVVGMRRVDLGARVDDDTVLTTLDDLVEIEIQFSVPELYYGAVRPGQAVSATTSAFPGRRFEGEIATIDSRIDEVSRAFRVRAVLPNPDLELPAGMFMHVEVILGERPAVLIPEQAVVAAASDTFVFTVEDGRAQRRDIQLGQRDFGEVEVLDGLRAGEVVVVSGVQRLREGLEVDARPADDAASAPPAPPGGDA